MQNNARQRVVYYHTDVPNGNATLGGGGGGGGDPDPSDSNGERKKKKKRAKKKVVIPNSFEVPIWGTFPVNSARYNIGAMSIGTIVSITIVIILWACLLVPLLPAPWYRYGAIYYMAILPFYIVNLFFPLNIIVTEMYGMFAILNTGAFGVTVWLLYLFVYNFYHCSVGDLPYTCTGNYIIDGAMLALTLVIGYNGLFTTVYFWSITLRTSATSRPHLIEYRTV